MARDDRRGGGEVRPVTSLQNERVKLIRSLEMRKARRETGLFVAEGASVLIAARDHAWTPRLLARGPGGGETGAARALVAWALDAGAECLDVSAAVLEKIAAKDNPQSLIGVLAQRFVEPPSPPRLSRDALWLALEEIRDPGNLGTILRTADAVGADGVILVGTTCDPFQREAVRASMGSIFAVPVARMDHASFAVLARAWPGDIIGTHLDGTDDFRKLTYRGPQLLLMGSEGPGLSQQAQALCGRLVKIPMTGRLDSLNLAVATALMLYELRRDHLRL